MGDSYSNQPYMGVVSPSSISALSIRVCDANYNEL